MWSPRLERQKLLQTSKWVLFIPYNVLDITSMQQQKQRKPSLASHYVGTITGAGLKIVLQTCAETETLRLQIWTLTAGNYTQSVAASGFRHRVRVI